MQADKQAGMQEVDMLMSEEEDCSPPLWHFGQERCFEACASGKSTVNAGVVEL